MVWHALVTIAKPFVYLWAALSVIDDLSLVMRLGRLGAAVIPRLGKEQPQDNDGELCGLCDDVMGDLMRGAEGLSVVPCGAVCLNVPSCVDMCKKLKTVSAETTEFPCVAAGYCDATDTVVDMEDPECHAGPLFSCMPRQYCRRKRKGFRFSCDLRPGIGRWVGLKRSASKHVVALATGLLSQPHCGEPDAAGIYCIAEPVGLGAIAEVLGHVVALVFGGYRSVQAIESPGGCDDRQWLTFWLILAVLLFVERFFARVILSTVPFYYEAKLALLVWLVWRSGAERVYRVLRQSLVGKRLLLSDEKAAARTLALMETAGKKLVKEQLDLLSKTSSKNIERKSSSMNWEYDDEEYSVDSNNVSRQLYGISKFLLSPEGAKALQESMDLTNEDKNLLLERAAEVVSFQPRFLRVHVRGVASDLPPMDRNGRADPYVKLQLQPSNGDPYPRDGIRSKIRFKTLRPIWNQKIELRLLGGSLDPDGYYRSNGVAKSTRLLVSVRDADVGQWSIAYYFFSLSAVAALAAAIFARVEGISDNVTGIKKVAVLMIILIIAAGLIISFVEAVVIRSDDETIGDCEMPIEMLLDQREHHFWLTLRKPVSSDKNENGTCGSKVGVLRVSLLLSEH